MSSLLELLAQPFHLLLGDLYGVLFLLDPVISFSYGLFLRTEE
jgi:hypothetical protein